MFLLPRVSAGLLAAAFALEAADQGLANLRFADDRLQLHPLVALGAGYDSNPQGRSDPGTGEYRGNIKAGIDSTFALTPEDTLDAGGYVQPTWRSQSEDRPDLLYQLSTGFIDRSPSLRVNAKLSVTRDDSFDIQSGTRPLKQDFTGVVGAERMGGPTALDGTATATRTTYDRVDPNSGLAGRDNDNANVGMGIGPRFGRLSLTGRVTGEVTRYKDSTTAQDSTGAGIGVGLKYIDLGTLEWTARLGYQARRYQASATNAGVTVKAPTLGLGVSWRPGPRSRIGVDGSGGLEDSLTGVVSYRTALDTTASYQITPHASGSLGAGYSRYYDLEVPSGGERDVRDTITGKVGLGYDLYRGVRLGLDGRVDRAWVLIADSYVRWSIAADLGMRF